LKNADIAVLKPCPPVIIPIVVRLARYLEYPKARVIFGETLAGTRFILQDLQRHVTENREIVIVLISRNPCAQV